MLARWWALSAAAAAAAVCRGPHFFFLAALPCCASRTLASFCLRPAGVNGCSLTAAWCSGCMLQHACASGMHLCMFMLACQRSSSVHGGDSNVVAGTLQRVKVCRRELSQCITSTHTSATKHRTCQGTTHAHAHAHAHARTDHPPAATSHCHHPSCAPRSTRARSHPLCVQATCTSTTHPWLLVSPTTRRQTRRSPLCAACGSASARAPRCSQHAPAACSSMSSRAQRRCA
jgi:hypothetical protein